jgi:protein Mpv17
MTAAAIAAPTSAFGRVWAAYLRQLSLRPLRTKMITSGTLFAFGDTIAQFGIEGRRFGAPPLEPGESDKDRVLPWDVS